MNVGRPCIPDRPVKPQNTPSRFPKGRVRTTDIIHHDAASCERA